MLGNFFSQMRCVGPTAGLGLRLGLVRVLEEQVPGRDRRY